LDGRSVLYGQRPLISGFFGQGPSFNSFEPDLTPPGIDAPLPNRLPSLQSLS
jgi:hypothetical protein